MHTRVVDSSLELQLWGLQWVISGHRHFNSEHTPFIRSSFGALNTAFLVEQVLCFPLGFRTLLYDGGGNFGLSFAPPVLEGSAFLRANQLSRTPLYPL